ncbi:MAG: PKD domain-containing protein [Ardenticatenaceae bacterium]|nr:PKD domain-containing protein [Ardenticatenaceae bacterium]
MKRLFFPILFMTTIVTLALAVTPQAAPAAQGPVFDYDFVVVRAYFSDKQMVADLAAWKEPWQVDYVKNFVVVEVTAVEYQQLLNMGFTVEIDEALTAALNTPRLPDLAQGGGIPGYACYRTVEETFLTAEQIAQQHPNLATWIDIGDSWEKVNALGGYDIMVLRLTNSAIPGPKPKLFIMSAIHAREYTTAELNTRFAEYLINNYGSNADATWLLDYNEIHLLLQANPDGRKQAETGLLWRKNTNQNYCSPTSNSRGADLNRNFQFEWGCCGGSSGSQCSTTYRGASPASEPEVQTVQNYVFSQFPDLRDPPITAPAPITTTGIFLDVHSSGGLVLWPWGFTNQVTGNDTSLVTLGRKFAYFNDYEPQQSIELYPTDGTTVDFAYGELGLPAYTFELGTQFFEACGIFENTILPDNMQALIYAAKATRAPYLEPAGPEALNLALAVNPVAVNGVTTVTVTIDDTRFNNSNGTEPTQNVAAAEFYIDTPPWVTTTVSGTMTAVDGNFDSPVEAAQATLDTTGLSQGRHTIFVRGQDANGRWGVLSATFLYIIDPAIAPTIGGSVEAAVSGTPLEATITANEIFQTTTDGSGQYQMQVISDTYSITAVPTDPAYAPATVTGIIAHNAQTIQQDFTLYPYCDIFNDDVEAGNAGWTTQGSWAITTESAHSPTHSWTDSPGGNYPNNSNISLTSPIFDLTDYASVTLNYWQICDTEAGYDYCTVEVSSDGLNWTGIGTFDGPHSQWEEITLAAATLDNQATAQFRFHFTSDGGVVDDGWHLDDITLRGAGPGCFGSSAPTAAFTTTSPDALGTATQFTNTSTGTDLTFTWNFGDGATGSDANPSHTYAATGSYTVILTATNTFGSDTTTGLVEILLAPTAAFDLFSPVVFGQTAVFTNTSTGDNLHYLWDFGDGATSTTLNPTHTYTATGPYTVTLTASNDVGSDAATAVLQVILAPTAAFTTSSPDTLGQTTTFTNTATGDNLHYLWDFGDGTTSTDPNPTHTYAATDNYTVTLTVSNEVGNDVATAVVAIIPDEAPTHTIYLPFIQRD